MNATQMVECINCELARPSPGRVRGRNGKNATVLWSGEIPSPARREKVHDEDGGDRHQSVLTNATCTDVAVWGITALPNATTLFRRGRAPSQNRPLRD